MMSFERPKGQRERERDPLYKLSIRTFAARAAAVASLAVGFLLLGAGTARADIAYGTDPINNLVFEVNLGTGALTNAVPITLPGFTVTGAVALTCNPVDNSIWGIVKTGGTTRQLATIDPTTGAATFVGTLSDRFSTLAFNSAGTLYAATGNGAAVPETLYTLNTVNAAATLQFAMGNGADGEILAFAPGNAFYHSSGNVAALFELVNLGPQTTTSLGSANGEMFGMGYSSGLSTMFGTGINRDLFSINLSNGARTVIGQTTLADGTVVAVRGLAIRAVPAPGAAALLGLSGLVATGGRRRRA